jgi:exonuclease SbcD
VELKGSYDELTLRAFYENTTWQEDYVHVTLTDEEDIPDAIGKLRVVYHRIAKLDYDNRRTRSDAAITGAADVESKTPLELYSDFFELQNNAPMSEGQRAYMASLIEEVWEEAL